MLDRMAHVLAGNVDLEANLVVGELFYLDGHASIQAKVFRLTAIALP
jgi:hypothetical protein